MDLKEYNRLRAAVDESKSKAAKASGAFEQAVNQLKKDFGVDSIEDAKARLEKMEKEEKQLEKELSDALAEFEKRWPGFIK